MKRIYTIIAASMMFMASAALASEPVRFGAILSITGPASFLGEPEKNTLLMLKDEINAKGGINGRPVEIVIEDSKSDETQAVLAAKKLIEKDKVVAIIGPSTTGESMAVIPVMTAAKVPLLSCAAGAPITLPAADRTWIFKTAQYDLSAAEAIFDYMKKKGIAKVGILTVATGFGDAGKKALVEMAQRAGIAIVAEERYGAKDTDMTSQLTKVKAAGAQAIINWSIGPTQIVVTKNWAALKMGIPLFQSHGWGSKKNLELAGKAAEGVIAPLSRIVVWDKLPGNHPQRELLKKYDQAYETRFKSEPGAFGGYAYDAFQLAVAAVKKVGTDPVKVRDYLENSVKGVALTSGTFTMSSKDHCGLDKSAFEMVVIKNGDWEILK